MKSPPGCSNAAPAGAALDAAKDRNGLPRDDTRGADGPQGRLRDPFRRTPPPQSRGEFRVVILANRPCRWGEFPTEVAAEACARKLRLHGFDARVERVRVAP